jgi:diaminohydroxyphosphoribosylaminopyrimidine deaminase/5-amino-6-(5-phosphoribosylamino)uracil reductase
MERLTRKGVNWIRVPARRGRVSLRALFRRLAARGMIRVMIEGGGETAASALEENLVDEVHFFIAPLIVGGRDAPSAVGGNGVASIGKSIRLTEMMVKKCGPDIHVYGRVAHSAKRKVHSA